MMQPKTKTILFILLSFALGAFAGGIYGSRYYPHRPARPSAADWRNAFAERIGLDSAQRTVVDSITEAYREKMNHFRQDIFTVRDTLRSEIRKVLTRDQNKRFDDFIKEIDERQARNRREDEDRKK